MEAQRIRIALHDESGGYPISPRRVPLGVLRVFAKDVDELLRGDAGDVAAKELEVAVTEGSLAIETAPTANPGLLQDLRSLCASQLIDGLNAKRRLVVERWQRGARSARNVRYEITSSSLPAAVIISATSDFHTDDADQWVRVERYVQGEVFELGGLSSVNAHLRLADGSTLLVSAARDTLSSDPKNRLFKQALVRIVADYNVKTREHRNAQLMEFVPQDRLLDENAMARMLERGKRAWADVPDAAAWVEELRGNDA
ncbi:MAG: hypothetical protein U5L05_04065 [Rubrivivax sp.]|nr:hypothetical protein [Rubrivivax sp.]